MRSRRCLLTFTGVAGIGLAIGASLALTVVKHRFVWEDDRLIVKNQYLRNPWGRGVLFRPAYWRHIHVSGGTAYRPLRELSFALDYTAWGLRPWGFHLTNVLLHVTNALLIGTVGAQLTSLPVGIVGAALFLIHPAGVEAFAWVKNRGELLAMTFFCASWLSFMRSCNVCGWRKANSGRAVSYSIALVAYVMGLLSKASLMALSPMFLATAFLVQQRKHRRKILASSIPFLAALIGYVCYRHATGTTYESTTGLSVVERANLVGATVAAYARMLLIPLHCRPLYDARDFCGPWVGAVGLGLLCAAFGILVWTFVRGGRGWILLAWLLLALAPVSNIVFLADRPIAEQRLYGMLAPACLLASMGICRAWKARHMKTQWLWVSSLAFGVFPLLTARCVDHTLHWRSNWTLWTVGVRAAPRLAKCYFNLSTGYSNAEEIRKAAWALRQAIRLDPRYALAYRRLAELAYTLDEYDRAEGLLYRALSLHEDDAEGWNLRGLLFVHRGRLEEAQSCFQRALVRRPDLRPAWQNLGRVYERLGDVRGAIAAYSNALGSGAAHDARLLCVIGDLYMRLNQPEEALKNYEDATHSDPSYLPAIRGKAEAERRRRRSLGRRVH